METTKDLTDGIKASLAKVQEALRSSMDADSEYDETIMAIYKLFQDRDIYPGEVANTVFFTMGLKKLDTLTKVDSNHVSLILDLLDRAVIMTAEMIGLFAHQDAKSGKLTKAEIDRLVSRNDLPN